MGNFEDLEKEVIEKGLCTHCGACLSACPDYNIEWSIDDRPRRDKAKSMCQNCTECYDSCHRVQGHFIHDQINQLVFDETNAKNESIGMYKEIIVARAKDKDIVKVSQDGGVASAIGLYLLDKDLVDGVITTGRDNLENFWKPISKVATNREELLKSAGTKYYIAPILKMLKNAVIDMELDRLAIIGLPCQIRSARFLQKRKTDLSYAVLYYIGLFCTHNY
jgi:coenzyme F420 hydrogenase subunit beta